MWKWILGETSLPVYRRNILLPQMFKFNIKFHVHLYYSSSCFMSHQAVCTARSQSFLVFNNMLWKLAVSKPENKYINLSEHKYNIYTLVVGKLLFNRSSPKLKIKLSCTCILGMETWIFMFISSYSTMNSKILLQIIVVIIVIVWPISKGRIFRIAFLKHNN